jgi:hypothetical protein
MAKIVLKQRHLSNEGAMTREEALAAGATRYTGKRCRRHPELGGERRNGNCPACQRERPRVKRKPDPEVQRRKVRKWRIANWERFSEGKLARNAALRAKAKGAGDTPPHIRRAWIVVSRRAQRFGLTIDPVIPLQPCRVCNRRGTHEVGNWQLLTKSMNSRKGNRCLRCARRDMLSRALPEEL